MTWFTPRTSSNLRYGKHVAFLVASWVPVMIVFNEHVCYFGKIEGASMRPTFNPTDSTQDWVFLWKMGLRGHDGIKVDDVVLFRSPQNPEKVLCKRVKGVQGDMVLTRHPYPRDQCHVPRSHLWVEGDNVHSIDSNNFGPISSGLVIGKAATIIWPPSRWMAVPEGGREARISKPASLGS